MNLKKRILKPAAVVGFFAVGWALKGQAAVLEKLANASLTISDVLASEIRADRERTTWRAR